MFSSAGCFQWENSLIVICESIFDSAEVVLFLYYALVSGDVLFLAKPLMMKNPFLISVPKGEKKLITVGIAGGLRSQAPKYRSG